MPYATLIIGSHNNLSNVQTILTSFLCKPNSDIMKVAGIQMLQNNTVIIDLEKAGNILGELQAHCDEVNFSYSLLITEQKQKWFSWPIKVNASQVKITGL